MCLILSLTYPENIKSEYNQLLIRFTKKDFQEVLLPKFAPELARQREIIGAGGKGGGKGPRPLTPCQELAIGLAFYASGRDVESGVIYWKQAVPALSHDFENFIYLFSKNCVFGFCK